MSRHTTMREALRDLLLSHCTIEVHQELRHGTTYAERHTLDLAMTDGSKQRLEVFIFGEYAQDGRFLRLHEAVCPLTAGPGHHS